jgi:acetyl-CoA carboxylase beta subunit
MARTVKCPSCGAELSVRDNNRDFMFCEFCGTKVRLDDYQETHRFVDEARIRESENNKELELKRMEFEEKKDKQALLVSGILLIGGIGMIFIASILEHFGAF